MSTSDIVTVAHPERAATHLLEDADLWYACDAVEGICNAGYRMLDPDGGPLGEDF